MSLSCAPATAVLRVTGSRRPNLGGLEQVRNWPKSVQFSPHGWAVAPAGAIAALLEAVGARDSYTRCHSNRVSRYAAAMAGTLGLAAHEQRDVALAGQLHDVGKIGVPDELLHKAGRLTPVELRQVLEHAVIGERILRPLLGNHPAVLAAVRWHHERVDGSGYPDGLRGEAIPLIARIVAVADALDAMTTARPYRRALPLSVAIAELRRGAGRQFDSRCVEAMLRVLRETHARHTIGHRFAARLRRDPVDPMRRCAARLIEVHREKRYTVSRMGGSRDPPSVACLASAPRAPTCDNLDDCAHRTCRAAGNSGLWGRDDRSLPARTGEVVPVPPF